ncbi:MAG TPA: DUF190 domain-containing protein [Candidatus Dormibacteraeota bacterium]|nr:DUF190 domain-containing protein [Candidatus Dormibacteraeota bacterium]
MRTEGSGRLLRIFVDEGDRWHGQPLHTAIVEMLRKHGVSGATVFRGVEGFGAHGELHVSSVFALMPNLPILIEVVDSDERIESVLPHVEEMVTEGLVTLERVDFRHYSRARN